MHLRSSTPFKDGRHKARLKRLGALGKPEDILNSVSCRTMGQTKIIINKKTKKQDARERIHSSKGGGPCSYRPSISCPARERLLHIGESPSVFKKPRLCVQVAISEHSIDTITNCKPEFRGGSTPSKRPRLLPTCISRVRGSCSTTGWSIDQYCEAGHG